MADNETGMPAADADFARVHAWNYAGGDSHPDQAASYANWYADQYLPGAESLEDLPAHDHAWTRYLDHEREMASGAEPADAIGRDGRTAADRAADPIPEPPEREDQLDTAYRELRAASPAADAEPEAGS